jgi:hypothetical protein
LSRRAWLGRQPQPPGACRRRCCTVQQQHSNNDDDNNNNNNNNDNNNNNNDNNDNDDNNCCIANTATRSHVITRARLSPCRDADGHPVPRSTTRQHDEH